MNSDEVVQWLKPREIQRRLARVDATQATLAYFGNVSDAKLSVCLAGRTGLSEKAQDSLERGLQFLEWMRDKFAPAPVDFRNVQALEPFFREFKKLSDAKSVVGTEDE
jgi:hypothetical protein